MCVCGGGGGEVCHYDRKNVSFLINLKYVNLLIKNLIIIFSVSVY